MLDFSAEAWVYASLLLSVAAIVAVRYYRHAELEELGSNQRLLLVGLRSIGVLLIAFLLLKPFLIDQFTEERPPKVILAIDNSQSMGEAFPDSSAIAKKISTFQELIGQKAEVVVLPFAERLLKTDSLGFDGTSTDISTAVNELEARFVNDPSYRAAYLISDGQQNQGMNPLLKASSIPFPLHTVVVGEIQDQKDAAILTLEYNRRVELGNRLEVSGIVRVQGYKGKKLRIDLIDEKGALLLSSQQTLIERDARIPFRFFPEAGEEKKERRWRIRLNSFEGESQKDNNERLMRFEVVEREALISFVFDGQHPDIAALARSLRDYRAYQIEYVDLRKGESVSKDSRLMVFAHPSAAYASAYSELLSLHPRTAVWFLAGYTESARMIGAMDVPLRFRATSGSDDDAQAAFTSDFSLFRMDDELLERLQSGSPLSCPYGQWSLPASAQVQIRQKINGVVSMRPMMLSMEDARGRRWGLLTGRGLWRWRMDEYRRFGSHQAFNTWTSSWVRYLQSKDDPSRLQIQYAEEVPLGGRWRISGRLKDASGEWTSAARMHMKLTDAEGDTASYNLLQDGERYYFGIQTRASGIHRFQVTSNLGEETFVQRGQFYVEDEALELQTKGADTALMGQLARQTGGKVFHLDSVQDLQAHFGAQTFEPLIRSRQERRALIDWKIFFFLILLLLATEWGLRRYFGLY